MLRLAGEDGAVASSVPVPRTRSMESLVRVWGVRLLTRSGPDQGCVSVNDNRRQIWILFEQRIYLFSSSSGTLRSRCLGRYL